ncbi:three-helix bundle dimerization domain-containing protein [Mycobacterium sp. PS03-16]|nr:hypothetical protein [Mycobacterium sp. PS03-16]
MTGLTERHKKHVYCDGRPVRDFIPLLVERDANTALSALLP